MKKVIVFILFIIIIVVTMFYLYINFKDNYNNIQKENKLFDTYYNREVYGTDLATVINKAVDNNTKNDIKKDNKGKYADNGINSINVDIKIMDNDKIYNMEKIYTGGISTFTSYYGQIKFKCTQIDYHEKTGRIKYMLFEQITK